MFENYSQLIFHPVTRKVGSMSLPTKSVAGLLILFASTLTLPAAAQDTQSTTIGGYGEIHYTNATGPDSPGEVNVARFVVYLAHSFSDRLAMRSELEVEDTKVEGGEPGGEIGLEQLYLDYRFSPAVTLRGGLLLPPIGIINETHEPPTFNGVNRPAYDHDVIPTTWRDIGVGVLGTIPGNSGLNYRVYLVNGLKASGFSADEGIRGGRQEGKEASFANPSLTGRLEWVRPGLTLGGSFWYGGSAAQDPALGTGAFDNAVTLLSADARYVTGPFAFRGEVAPIGIADADQIDAAYGNGVAHRITGGYLEASANLLAGLAPNSSQKLLAFARHERFNTQGDLPGGATGDPVLSRRITTVGLTYLPTFNVAIKGDYTFNRNRSDTAQPDVFALGLGYAF
jgi:hypothetical protein